MRFEFRLTKIAFCLSFAMILMLMMMMKMCKGSKISSQFFETFKLVKMFVLLYILNKFSSRFFGPIA